MDIKSSGGKRDGGSVEYGVAGVYQTGTLDAVKECDSGSRDETDKLERSWAPS